LRHDLDVSGGQTLLGAGPSPFQFLSRFTFVKRIENHPDAEFVLLQTRREIRDQNVQQVSLVLVEMAEASAPGDVPHSVDPGLP
jgi:hypothetical protein